MEALIDSDANLRCDVETGDTTAIPEGGDKGGTDGLARGKYIIAPVVARSGKVAQALWVPSLLVGPAERALQARPGLDSKRYRLVRLGPSAETVADSVDLERMKPGTRHQRPADIHRSCFNSYGS